MSGTYPYLSTGFPRSLAYFAQRLSNVSINTLQLIALGNEAVTPNDTISYNLPEGAILDLRTLQLKLTGCSTTTTNANAATSFAVFPKHIETLIDQITVSVNGQVISQTPNQYGQIFKLLADYGFGRDKAPLRTISQNQRMSNYASEAEELAKANPANPGYISNANYIVSNWLGFLGSAAPPLLFTGALGQVRVDIRFAPESVLYAGGAAAPAPTYNVTRAYMTVRTLDLDGLYYDLLAKRMADSPLEIPFTSYIATTGNVGSVNQTVRLNVSSGCVDMALATFLRSDYTTNTGAVALGNLAPNPRTSWYFKRGAAMTTTTFATGQYSVNNTLIAYPQPPIDIFGEVLHTLGGLDSVGGHDQYMGDMGSWLSDCFVHPLCLNVGPTENGDRLLSGTDARGTQLQIAYTSTGTANNVIPYLIVVCKSVLKVSPGRNIIVDA